MFARVLGKGEIRFNIWNTGEVLGMWIYYVWYYILDKWQYSFSKIYQYYLLGNVLSTYFFSLWSLQLVNFPHELFPIIPKAILWKIYFRDVVRNDRNQGTCQKEQMVTLCEKQILKKKHLLFKKLTKRGWLNSSGCWDLCQLSLC